MRLGPMLALLLLPACSLARAPIVDGPRDAGMDVSQDAGLDAGFDAGLRDTPEGIDAPLDTGIDAPLDTGVDAPLDTGVDAPLDTGVDAGRPDTGVDAPPPRTCMGRFGSIPGYMECSGASAGLCRFYADPTSDASCDTLCALAPGGRCVGVVDDMGVRCATTAGGIPGGCSRPFNDMVCTCTLGD